MNTWGFQDVLLPAKPSMTKTLPSRATLQMRWERRSSESWCDACDPWSYSDVGMGNSLRTPAYGTQSANLGNLQKLGCNHLPQIKMLLISSPFCCWLLVAFEPGGDRLVAATRLSSCGTWTSCQSCNAPFHCAPGMKEMSGRVEGNKAGGWLILIVQCVHVINGY